MISNSERGRDDSREQRGTFFSLRTCSISTKGAKTLSQAIPSLPFRI
jgi:hypothetical protein